MTTPKKLLVDGLPRRGIPADDPGLLLGLTVFETLRTYGRAPFRLEAHLDRLEHSAKMLDIVLPPRSLIAREVTENAAEDARIRFTVTAGGHRILDVAPIDQGRVCAPVSVDHMRWDVPEHLPGAVKHGSRASWIVAARRLGVDEVLLVDRHGHILEANRSNVLAVKSGALLTPPLDGRQLVGVTRGALLEAAEEAGLPMRESPLAADDAYDELYLTSTLKQMAPVVSVRGVRGPGHGPVGRRLLDALLDLIERETGTRPPSPQWG
jgi:branched-chain amino acid aminotransferase